MVQALAARASREALPEPVTQSRGHHQADLKSHLDAVSVPVCAVLGTGHLSMQDLLDLRPGDIIRLDSRADQELAIAIGAQNAYLGRPGRVGEKLAVQITSIAVKPGDNATNRQSSPSGRQPRPRSSRMQGTDNLGPAEARTTGRRGKSIAVWRR